MTRTAKTAHYIITGIDTAGEQNTPPTEGLSTLMEAGEYALDYAESGWMAVHVFRVDIDGYGVPTFTDVTPDAANHAFSKWLENYGAEPADWPIPWWLFLQLERLCIDADRERRAYIMGERTAFPALEAA
jgi:hypothetical protein